MSHLAWLLCLNAIAAQGGPTPEDRRILAEMGLQSVGGNLVQIGTATTRRASGKPRIRQGGPVCYWYLSGFGGLPAYPEYAEEPYPYYDSDKFEDARSYAELITGPGFLGFGTPIMYSPYHTTRPIYVGTNEPQPVPEPASILLFSGFIGILAGAKAYKKNVRA